MLDLRSLAFVAALLVSAPGASAQQPPLPGSGPFNLFDVVNAWVIYAEQDSGRCVMERLDEAGTLFQIGRTRAEEDYYFGLFTQNIRDFPAAGRSDLIVDDRQFAVDLTRVPAAQTQAGLKGGYVVLEDAALSEAIFNGRVMSLVPSQGSPVIVDLTGTAEAIESARACEAAL